MNAGPLPNAALLEISSTAPKTYRMRLTPPPGSRMWILVGFAVGMLVVISYKASERWL